MSSCSPGPATSPNPRLPWPVQARVQLPLAGLLAWLTRESAQWPYFCWLHSADRLGPEPLPDPYACCDLLVGWAGPQAETLTQPQQLEQLPLQASSELGPGWLGALSYELGHALLEGAQTDSPWPPAWIAPPPVALFRPQAVLQVPAGAFAASQKKPQPQVVTVCVHTQLETAQRLVQRMEQEIAQTPAAADPTAVAWPRLDFQPRWSPQAYQERVQAVRQAIASGDVYELNLTQEHRAQLSQHHQLPTPGQLHQALTLQAPVPYGGLLVWNHLRLVAASPERFLAKRGAQLVTQPMKGTLPRGGNPAQDDRLAHTLQTDEKMRAENVMIADLARNDLQRICHWGSVQAPGLFTVQRFPYVHQLISTIVGELRPEVGPRELFAALWPPGSMTGAPKLSACRHIRHLEQSGRGWYSGALGWWGPNGDMDWSVVIRSLVVDAQHRRLSYHVGGAVTWDSDPQAEYNESELKAKALRTALQRIPAAT